MLFWLALAAAIAWLLWYMVKVPGASYSGALKPLSAEEQLMAEHLRRHVAAIASREHNLWTRPALEDAARYIERTLASFGHSVETQRFAAAAGEVRNVEVEVKGASRAAEIIVVGAHYD